MNKYIVLGIGLLVLLGLIIAIKLVMPTIKDTKELELTYELNAGIPFKRIFEIEDPTIVEFVRSYVLKDENVNGIVGASVYTNYVFKGLKEGTTTITFKVISITDENDVMSEDKNIVKVDQEGNITLIKNEQE